MTSLESRAYRTGREHRNLPTISSYHYIIGHRILYSGLKTTRTSKPYNRTAARRFGQTKETTMYLNRVVITAISRLKTQWGPERFSQTNSRFNGSYLKHVRLYPDADAKKARKNFIALHTLAEINAHIGVTDKDAK